MFRPRSTTLSSTCKYMYHVVNNEPVHNLTLHVRPQIRSAPHNYALKPRLLKTNRSKFTRDLEPLNGDARSAKSFEFLTLIFSTDCSRNDRPQSALKITRLKMYFFFV